MVQLNRVWIELTRHGQPRPAIADGVDLTLSQLLRFRLRSHRHWNLRRRPDRGDLFHTRYKVQAAAT